ncbi:MAG: hypothetical protein GXY11_03405 [Clostridiales bacterium]|nr:hypothetical protein [Clostridiales bacterium]
MERGIVSAVNGRRARVKRPDGYVTGWLFLVDAVLSANAGDIVFYEPFGNDGLILHAVGAPGLADVFALANEVLPLSGGSLTGDLDINGNAVWHTGNLYHVEWTPYLRGVNANPSVTYIRQRGMATKIGPLVVAPFEILTDTVSGGSGHAYIHGTPFPVYSGQAGLPYSALVYNDDITGVTVNQMGIHWNGSYWILTWGTASERLQADNLLNGFHVFGTLIYHTSA